MASYAAIAGVSSREPLLNERQNAMISIVVGSTNDIQIAAVKAAAAELGIEAEVEGLEADSGVPRQPYEALTTLMGAKFRADGIHGQRPGAYALAIQNGLVPKNGRTHDLAYVAIVTPHQKHFSRCSESVPVPAELVELSRASGWTQTAGELEAARSGCDPGNPHRVWSDGKTDCQAILAQAVREALRAALSCSA